MAELDPPTEGQIALAVLAKLTGNKKTRGATLKLLKEVHPELQIPELDAVEPVNAELAELRRGFAALEKRLSDRDADGNIEKTFGKLQNARGYTDQGIIDIQKLMIEKKIPDAEAAADHYDKIEARKAPPQLEPGSAWGGQSFLTKKDPDISRWFTETDTMVDEAIGAVLAEAHR